PRRPGPQGGGDAPVPGRAASPRQRAPGRRPARAPGRRGDARGGSVATERRLGHHSGRADRLRPRPPRPMKLSVVIPCYNEAATLERLLRAVRAAPWAPMEVIVVDDRSTDGSRELLQGELASLVDRLVLHEVNRGKGAALRSGI